ncbi:small conductance mechanosensitive channel [Tamaricihabitans halophyticus]|uniref:Small conductance mechanosensitive channel n=1 Tax=Tamaricihabitans halophyticus TaxID=1262583 RepID=A0A4V2SSY7_9PSEU|nr:mechanosensitive ion channel family protein [Tamaricihabitans halophyticus]TCP48546.1 small conductance mechanosensitive channel [Tamaricihabitans halophyticus]
MTEPQMNGPTTAVHAAETPLGGNFVAAPDLPPIAQGPAPTPPACTESAGSWCDQIYRLTHNDWLASSAEWLVAKPLNILLILVIAFVVRWLARRVINRLTSGNGIKTPAILRPLRERAPAGLSALNSERRRQRARTIGSVLKSITSFVVFGLAFVLILGELGIQLGPIIASAGILGVALGFGAQNLVKDFLSGMFMMLEDQYGVGDWVDLGEASGTVEAIGLRVTTLRDVGGTVWYVRNGEVIRVGNSSQGFAVAVVDLPVSYEADVEQATRLLAAVAEEATSDDSIAQHVLEPPEVLGVEQVSAESLTLRLTVKVRPGQQWRVQRVLRGRIMAALEDAGFEPPMARLFGTGPQGGSSTAQQGDA